MPLTRMGRTVFRTAAEEDAAHKLAPRFSEFMETYIDPYNLCLMPATGYWSHVKQDVMRFTGHHKPGRPYFDFGSWDLRLSDIARKRFQIIDCRGDRTAYCAFDITVC